MPVFRDDEGNERISPSKRAIEARDKWLSRAAPDTNTMREQLSRMRYPTEEELDAAVDQWRRIVGDVPEPTWRKTIASKRARQLRQARRRLRLALTVCSLAIGTALALVIFYGILGYH